MTDLRQAAQQAIEALTYCEALNRDVEQQKTQAITALRKALEQPEQEPVASIYISQSGEREFDDWKCKLPIGRNLLYTTPPAAQPEQVDCPRCGHVCSQRPWVGLTPEEILDLFDRNNVYGSKWIEFARTVEAKLKAKNDH